MQPFTPTGDKVVVAIQKVQTTEAGLILPDGTDTSMLEPVPATVVAVGPKCVQVKAGDRIISVVGQRCIPFVWNKQQLVVLNELEILAVLN